jgi:hypothetical protein
MQRSSTTDPNEESYEESYTAADEDSRHPAHGSTGATRHAVRHSGRGRSRRHAVAQRLDDPMATARTRRRRRVQMRRGNTLLLAAAGALSFILLAMIFEPQNGAIAEYHRFQDQVEQNEVKFNTFKAQHEVMQRRLASLQLDKGREQILVEKGFVKPGERILLFPPEPDVSHRVDTPENTETLESGASPVAAPFSDKLPSDSPAPSQSESRHSGGTLSGWWRSLRGLPRGATPGSATTLGDAQSSRPSSPDAASGHVATH